MTEAELLAAVVAAPDDDAPRLVYADWLIEQGDPRGELIAQQIQNPVADYRPATAQMRAWAPLLHELQIGWRLRRGFVEAIAPPSWKWLDRAGEIFAAHPIDHLMLTNCSATQDGIAALASSPVAPRIRKLSIYSPVSGRVLAPLLSGFVRELAIQRTLDRDVAEMVARWERLERLEIGMEELPVDAAVTIATGSSLARVRTLALGTMGKRGADVSAMVDALVANQAIQELADLRLDWNKLDRLSLRTIFSRFPLERASFVHCWITDAAARMLAELPGVDGLRRLALENNELADAGKQVLRDRLGDRVTL